MPKEEFQLKTINNLDFYEVSSTFQKAIRRGEEQLAIQCAAELKKSNFAGYVWKRLRIIVSEDIGLAEPYLPLTINALHDTYNDLKKSNDKHEPENLQLIHAVILCCRAKKSRLIDWATVYVFRTNEKITIPDYAYDMHTRKGRKLGRGIEHFAKEGAKLNNHFKMDGEDSYEQKALAVIDNKKGLFE